MGLSAAVVPRQEVLTAPRRTDRGGTGAAERRRCDAYGATAGRIGTRSGAGCVRGPRPCGRAPASFAGGSTGHRRTRHRRATGREFGDSPRPMLIGAHVREDDPLARRPSAAPRSCSSSSPIRRAGRSRRPPAGRRSCARATLDRRRPLAVRGEHRVAEQPHPHPVAQARGAARRRGGRGRARSGSSCTAGTSPRATTRPGLRQLAQVLRAAGRRGRLRGARSSSRTPRAATTPWPAGSTRSPGSGTRSASSTSASASTPATRTPRGEDLVDVVDRVKAITGRIDLVHLNDSRDEFGSARDRHANIGSGHHRPRAARRGVRRRRRPGGRRDPGRRARPRTSRSCATGCGRGRPPRVTTVPGRADRPRARDRHGRPTAAPPRPAPGRSLLVVRGRCSPGSRSCSATPTRPAASVRPSTPRAAATRTSSCASTATSATPTSSTSGSAATSTSTSSRT